MLDSRPIAELIPIIETVLASGGCFRLWPRGRSMRPLLREGRDSVLLSVPEEICRGDILLVRYGDRFLLHRAVRVEAEGITLCGDALTEPEGPLPPSTVIAKVTAIFRGERLRRHTKLWHRPYLCLIAMRRAAQRLWHKIF